MTSKILHSVVLAGAASLAIAAGLARADTPVPAQKILVIPFSALNVSESQQWISKGVQEDVIADLGRAGSYSPIAFQGQLIVEDNATAVRLARQASADFAVRGAAQVVGDNVRLTAQLINARTGDTVNTASVTGPVTDLLRLEDALSAQLRGANVAGTTGPATSGPATEPAGIAGGPPIAQQPMAPQIIVVPSADAAYPYSTSPAYQPTYPTTSYPYDSSYGYPDYYPSYYYPYLPLIISSVNGRRDFRGHDHGNPGGGHVGHGGGSTGGIHGGRSLVANSFSTPTLRGGGSLPISTSSFGAFHFSQPNPQNSFFGNNASVSPMSHSSFGGSSVGVSHSSMSHGRR